MGTTRLSQQANDPRVGMVPNRAKIVAREGRQAERGTDDRLWPKPGLGRVQPLTTPVGAADPA